MIVPKPPDPKRRESTGKVPYPANYGDATLSDVTRAVLGYRPKRVTAVDERPPRSASSQINPTV